MIDHGSPAARSQGDTNDPLELALRLAFRPPAARQDRRSVLDVFGARAGGLEHVHLRDPGQEVAPIIKPGAAASGMSAFGRYQVCGEIARGGVGVVLRGRDPELGRDLAIKVLLETHERRPEMVRRFIEEAQIAGQLQHPGVVPVYDLGLLGGDRPYFTMKLIQGRTLAALLEARPGPASDRRRFLGIFEQVCQTVAYAHARGVVHRDLKPANVMVGAFGEVQVMDWGLAKVLAHGGAADEARASAARSEGEVRTVRSHDRSPGHGSTSVAGQILGTPAYMAPEQARGDVQAIDERADVFGLGAILCEVLTGKPPHAGRSAPAACRSAAEGNLDDAIQRLDASTADPELIAIAKRCLQPKLRERPRDAGVVAREVSAYLAAVEERARAAELSAAELRAKADEAAKTALQEQRARRLTRAWAATVVLAVLIGAGGYVWMDRERRGRADAALAAVTGEMQVAASLRGQAEAAAKTDLTLWAGAVAAARRAEGMARTGGIDAAAAGLAERLARDIEALEERARVKAERAATDRDMVARLEAIRAGLGDHWEWAREDAEYAQAFRGHGIDVEALDVDGAASRVRASPISAHLSIALDEWIRARRKITSGPDARRDKLGTILLAADPDPWRARLRVAAEEQDGAALLALAGALEIDSAPPESVDLLASSLAAGGQLAPALDLWRRAALRHPGDFWIHHNLASWVVDARPPRHEERVMHAVAALSIRPDSTHTWIDLADALHGAGDFAGAVKLRREVVARRPLSEEAHYNLGNALAQGGDPAGAIVSFREALRLRPDFGDARVNLGTQLEVQGDVEGAIAEYRQAILQQPRHAGAHHNLSAALLVKGDVSAALDSVRETLRLEPSYRGGQHALGITLSRLGDIPGAEAAFRAAVKLDPEDSASFFNLGATLGAQGDFDGALAAYAEATRLRPDYAEAHVNRGALLAYRGDLKGAVAAYQDALRARPDYADAHYNLGNALAALEDVDGAVNAFSEAARLEPAGSAYSNLGAMLGRKGDMRGALAAHRDAVRHAPGSAVAQYNFACALDWEGDLDGAIAAHREAVLLAPGRAAMRADLARACRRRGFHAEAVEMWEALAAPDGGVGEDWEPADRVEAVRSASGAACGEGWEPAAVAEDKRAGWRARARVWLRADLDAWRASIAAAPAGDKARAAAEAARQAAGDWLVEADLACLRDAPSLARLPAEERTAFEALWSDVRSMAAGN